MKWPLIGLTFLMILSASCSSGSRNELRAVEAKPVWFNGPDTFTVKTREGEIPRHGFFDLAPYPLKKENNINFVLLTPPGSHYGYRLDLVSGQRYKRFNYCEQDDVWRKYGSTIEAPRFSLGYVPRVLDQLGDPQSIVVFGAKKYLAPESLSSNGNAVSQRVRVVGGVVEQYCRSFPCLSRENWLSRMILVAVNPKDPKYSKVTNLGELKKKAKWRYLKAFIENGKGRTLSAKGEEPAYRMVGEIEARKALVFALSKGHYFTFKEMQDLRKSCHRLYDYIWDSSLLVRREIARKMSTIGVKKKKKKRAKVVNLSTKYRFMEQKQRYMEDLLEEKKEVEKKKKDFGGNYAKLFREIYNTYGDRFRTCQKYVRPANIQSDRGRFWYFAYLAAYYKLESLGFIYNCGKRGWIENPVTANGKLYYDNKLQLNSCTTEELDHSFEEAVRVLAGLARAGKEHHRFIEYDYGVGGSHQKLYSWVHSNGKDLKCSDQQIQKDREKKARLRIFPLDISWRNFRFKKRGKYDLIF